MKQVLRTTSLKSGISLLRLSICIGFLASAPTHAADNPVDPQQELVAVGEAITAIQTWLVEAQSQQSEALLNLQQADLQISTLSQSMSVAQAALSETETEIVSLSEQADQLNARKVAQGEILAQTLRTTYMAGNQSAIELLLNQEDISKSTRMLHYHRLFTQAQLARISSFQETLHEISEINLRLQSRAADLNEEQLVLSNTLQELSESKVARQLALSELRTEIATRNSELEQLEIDQVQLQELMEEVSRAVADIPASLQRSPFAAQLGKLPMPVKGEIVDRFGSRYGEGNLARQGITIAVSEGTPVQAIHPGRVVFSDWLRGTGLLVIVDHGEGYMSLYGANQALSKQAGDWVDVGDVLATSGRANELTGSGGSSQAAQGMYFEIRHHGEAQNPARWFSE